MKDFILTYYPIIQRIISCMSFVYAVLLLFLTGPVMLGSFQRLHLHFLNLVKLHRSDQSPATQLELIKDQIRAIEQTIEAAQKLPDLSNEDQAEMLRMLKFCEVIQTNAPHSPSFIEDYLCDLHEMIECLQEMVPPTLYALNPYFFHDIPPKMTPLEWHIKNIRIHYLTPHMCSFLAFCLLIKGIYFPMALTVSFLPVVFLTFYMVYLYRYIHTNATLSEIDEVSLKHYQKCYYHMLFVLLLTLIIYVVLRFLLFS